MAGGRKSKAKSKVKGFKAFNNLARSFIEQLTLRLKLLDDSLNTFMKLHREEREELKNKLNSLEERLERLTSEVAFLEKDLAELKAKLKNQA